MPEESVEGGPWVHPRALRDDAEARLFCLPFAGGGAAIWHAWTREAPEWLEVLPVLLPGRDRRLRETPARDARVQADALAAGLAPYLDRPFALLGHSMGALLSFELARRLRELGAPEPVHLFAAGFRAPHLPDRNTLIAHLPDGPFLAGLAGLGGMPPEVLASAELMRLLLPTLRADMTLVETYAHRPGAPLGLPITAFCAASDALVSEDEMAAWAEHTSAPFTLRVVPGGHFFLEEARPLMLPEVVRVLARHAGGPAL